MVSQLIHIILTILIVSLCFTIGSAQEDINDIRSKYQKALSLDDKENVKKGLQNFVDYFMSTNHFDSATYYLNLQKNWAFEHDDLETELQASTSLISIELMFDQEHKDSLLEERVKVFNRLDTSRCSDAFNSEMYSVMKNYYLSNNYMDSALVFAEKAHDFAIKSEDPVQIVINTLGLVELKVNLHQYEDAINGLLASEHLVKDNAYMDKIVSIRFYKQFGRLMIKIGDFKKAKLYLDEGQRLARSAKYEMFVAQLDYDLAYLYRKMEDYESAYKVINKSIAYFNKVNIANQLKYAYIEKTDAALASHDLDTFQQTINIFKQRFGDADIEMQLNEGHYFLAKDDLISSKRIIDQLKDKKIASTLETTYLDLIYGYQYQSGDYRNAIETLKSINQRRDSIRRSNNNLQIYATEAVYHREKQDATIDHLNSLNAAQDKALAVRNTALTLGAIMIVILGLLLTMLYRLFKANQLQNVKLSKALDDNQTLLKEIHHRVKNNLQVVSSLLSMQARRTQDVDAKEALQSSKSRVQSMSILHQNLYKGEDIKNVDVDEYINQLVDGIYSTYNVDNKIKIAIDADPVALDIDTLIPLGLITNELIINSLKHGFVGRESGQIDISLKQNGDNLILTVKDNGIGLPEGRYPDQSQSLGIKLIKSFVNRLEGKLDVDGVNGTLIQVSFDPSKDKTQYG